MYDAKKLQILFEYLKKISLNFNDVSLFLESPFFFDIFFEINFNSKLNEENKIIYKDQLILYFKNYNYKLKNTINIIIFLETFHFFYLLLKIKNLLFINLLKDSTYYKELYYGFYKDPSIFFSLHTQTFKDNLKISELFEFILNYYLFNNKLPESSLINHSFEDLTKSTITNIYNYFDFKIKFYQSKLSMSEIDDFIILRKFLINIQKLNYNFKSIVQFDNEFLIDLFLFNTYINFLQNIEHNSLNNIIFIKNEKIQNINIPLFINSTPDFFNLLNFFYTEKIIFQEDFLIFYKSNLFKQYLQKLDKDSQIELLNLVNLLINKDEFTIVDLINYIKVCSSSYFSSFKSSNNFLLMLELLPTLKIEFFEIDLKNTEFIELNLTQTLLKWITLDNFLELTFETLKYYTNSIEFLDLLIKYNLKDLKINNLKFNNYITYIIHLLSFMYFVKFFYLLIEKKMSIKFLKLVDDLKNDKFKNI